MKIEKWLRLKNCCFCFPLHSGIIFTAFVNIVISVIVLVLLMLTTQHKRAEASVEELLSTSLFAIVGMGIILNVLLLISEAKSDISMLRLFSYYIFGTILAAAVNAFILLVLWQIYDVVVVSFSIAMHCYVFVLVRSEIISLEDIELEEDVENTAGTSEAVVISEDVNLL